MLSSLVPFHTVCIRSPCAVRLISSCRAESTLTSAGWASDDPPSGLFRFQRRWTVSQLVRRAFSRLIDSSLREVEGILGIAQKASTVDVALVVCALLAWVVANDLLARRRDSLRRQNCLHIRGEAGLGLPAVIPLPGQRRRQ